MNPPSLLGQNTRHTVLLLVAAHLCLALAYSVWNPIAEAPDEADHWALVVYLAQEQQLPTGPWMTQGKHPPLAHIGAALLALLAEPGNDFLHPNPQVQLQPTADGWSPNFFLHTDQENWPWQGAVLSFHLARLWSVLTSTATVTAAYGLARTVWPHQTGRALAATGLVALLPEFVFIGSAINNDITADLFGTLALWGALAIYRAGGDWRAGWWTPLALGAGLLTKVSTAALWPAVGLALLAGSLHKAPLPAAQHGGTARLLSWQSRWLSGSLAVFLPALLLASPWLLRNWQLYGDPLGLELVRQTVDQRLTPWGWADTRWLLSGWFVSFWGKFGGAGHLPMADWVYWLLAGLTAASAAGWVKSGWRQPRTQREVLALLGLALLSTAASIWNYSLLALGTDQGRLLFPALAAAAVLWIEGLANLLPASWQPPAGALLLVLLASLSLYALVGVIRPALL